MENKIRIFYLGEDPFTGKIVETLFSKKGMKINMANEKLFIDTAPGDLVLLDLPDQINERTDIHQVLLSYRPVANQMLKCWCKTPMNEENLDNLLFYIRKEDLLLRDGKADFTFGTGKINTFLGDDEEGKREVVAEFLQNLSTNYRRLEENVKSGNIQGVREVSHKMLSGSEYYEVYQLNRILRLLENDNTSVTAGELHDLLGEVYEQVVMLRSGLIRQFF